MRTVSRYDIDDTRAFRDKAVHWASRFEKAVCLDSNDHRQAYSSFDFLLAADAAECISCGWNGAFDKLEDFHQQVGDWLFGYCSYDLKNGLESLNSQLPDGLQFPEMFFFRPVKLMILRGKKLETHYLGADTSALDLQQILELEVTATISPLNIKPRLSRDQYLERVGQMQRRIGLGDIYEANFCMEFFAHGQLDLAAVFQKLNEISKAPFSAFLRSGDHYLMSASPERYLRKQGSKLISQPIKGTAPRDIDPVIDRERAEKLSADPKERSENIMIVDLVRNDLSRTAKKGSVKVEELCEVHTFKQVHQLISTVTSQLREGQTGVDALRTTFPMGSMTGAPKISAMKIIEQLEVSKRGLYSGAVGYFTPQGDFDFSVVIRSVLYNSAGQYASFHVGSAITHLSDPKAEYDECMVKAAAMMRVLGG